MSKKTFLTSMTPDGTPGRAVEWVNDGEGEPVQSSAQQFAEPTPYFSLSPEEVKALEKERKTLEDSLPRLGHGSRAKAEKRIRQIDLDLKRQRMVEETVRRNQERAVERDTQRSGGDSGIGGRATHANPQSVAEQVAAVVTQVNAVIGSKSARQDSALSQSKRLVRPWPDQLAPQAGPPRTAVSAKVCCSGPKQYWCGKCKAKAKA